VVKQLPVIRRRYSGVPFPDMQVTAATDPEHTERVKKLWASTAFFGRDVRSFFRFGIQIMND
jgi:hypothetical protein